MYPVNTAETDAAECPVGVELVNLRRIAKHLRDLASYLANNELDHEAAYVRMAFVRVQAKLARGALNGAPEPVFAACD